MKAKRRKLRKYLCETCGKEMAITVPPYLRERMRRNGTICECDDLYFKKPKRWK